MRPVRPALRQNKLGTGESSTLQNSSKTAGEVSVYTISNPPLDGFVPWIAVQATNKDQNFDWFAYFSTSVLGYYLVLSPQTSYGIGLLDTGAGISVLSNAVATRVGLFSAGFNTGGTVPISGVTGTVDAWVSQPFGLWITGLQNIDPALNVNLASMVGEYNVSVAMGDVPGPGMPDLATAIGAPMAVYMASSIRNDMRRSINHNGTVYEGPEITFFDTADPAAPQYANSVPLEIRPTGAIVWYYPCIELPGSPCPGGDSSPQYPSWIEGNGSQGLFFLGSVNLSDRGYVAQGKTKFMLDTGAQVTVVGSLVGAQLGLNPNSPDFTVEIQGVDGQVTYKPGFYLDTLDVPALGEWLSYTHVPVVLLDVASPEGGTLEGIIGMNLFVRYNLVLRGGAFSTTDTPNLEFEPLPGINADYDGDGDVDAVDFAYLQTCLSGTDVPQTDPYCQYAFLDGDDDVDTNDLLLFMQCASGPSVPAPPECRGL